jgi:siroheme decarboxylase
MDDLDKKILNEIQSNFPVSSSPYLELGVRLDISEDMVIDRIKKLKEDGIIRRIGGSLNSRKLDFTSTLCAAKVPAQKMDAFVETVNSYKGVTHNYLRKNDYNVWFTFIGPSVEYIERCLEEISRKTGVDSILNMPAVRTFKIRVEFEV